MSGFWEFDNTKDILHHLIGEDFGQMPEDRLEDIRKNKKNIAEHISKKLSLKSSDHVLEIGSGIGFMSAAIAPQVGHLYCCDVSQSFLNVASQECKGLNNVSFHHIASARLDFLKDATLDAIFSYNVFIHMNLFDMYWYFQEIHRVLKPGGRFYFDIATAEELKDGKLPPLFTDMAEHYRSHPPNIPCLVQWNSCAAVSGLAQRFGFDVQRPYLTDSSVFIIRKK